MYENKKFAIKLDVIIPVFNEEECLHELMKRLLSVCAYWEDGSFNLIFVNDGSNDLSLDILLQYANNSKHIKIINLSRNFGHQIAMTAGLNFSNADFVVIIDADLQDPPELIIDLYKKALTGYDVVYAQRTDRQGESIFKKLSAKLFYRFLSKLSNVHIPQDVGDFRIVSKRVVKNINEMTERHRYIRGMIPWLGFKSTFIGYHREKRFSGKTKYSLKKMINFSKDAIFSFTDFPLRLSFYIGTRILIFALIGTCIIVYLRLFTSYTVPGISTVIILILFMGGLQIFIIGIIGEYIARIYEETKNRPLYIVSSKINFDK